MSRTKKQRTEGQFLSGLAWTFLIVAGWASIRLILWLFSAVRIDAEFDGRLLGLSSSVSKIFVFVHLGLALTTIYASFSLLKSNGWARIFFIFLLFFIALEASIYAGYLAFGSHAVDASELASKLPGIKFATSGAILLLGIVAGLVGWKLLR